MNLEDKIVWQKMINGERYYALHSNLVAKLMETRSKLWEINNIHPEEIDEINTHLRGLFGSVGSRFQINLPFRCDFGCNIHIGENFFANFNLTILDEAEVRIGSNVLIGPNVNIFTACHPIEADERNKGIEWAEGVTIGNNVWIGGGVTIVPGVKIGDDSVIGAGAVVTKDVPERVVVAGNPAKIIKQINIYESKH